MAALLTYVSRVCVQKILYLYFYSDLLQITIIDKVNYLIVEKN